MNLPPCAQPSRCCLRRFAFLSLVLFGFTFSALAQNNVRTGYGRVVASDITHPNGNIYDQVLMTGPSVTVSADAGQVVRVSFLDDSDDITQVEFAGSGTVTIELEPGSYRPPATPTKYRQSDVQYVKGHATVLVNDARADSYVSIFSVGRGNAVNASLFPEGMTYDAMADVQLLRVEGAECGGIFTGNVRYTSSTGATGLQAPNTAIRYRVVVGEITASGDAVPLLRIGANSQLASDGGAVLIAGGELRQSNGTPVDVSGGSGSPWGRIRAVDGTRSDGQVTPATTLAAEYAANTRGVVIVNDEARTTRGFIPTSFDQLLGEAGFSTFDFGDGVSFQFSGGNNGTYTYAEDTVIEGEPVHLELAGSYSYAVAGTNQNHMTFVLTFSTIRLTSRSVSFSGTVQDLARLSGEALPVRITMVADFTSSVSGSAIATLLLSTGAQQTAQAEFDLDQPMDFRFL